MDDWERGDFMIGAWLEDNILTVRKDIPLPELHSGESLIKVYTAGICGTDIELIGGYYPFTGVIGHEFVGEVIESIGEWCEKNDNDVVFIGSFISDKKGSDTEDGVNIAFGHKDLIKISLKDFNEHLANEKKDFVNW